MTDQAKLVERLGAALDKAEGLGMERILFGRSGPGLRIDDLRVLFDLLASKDGDIARLNGERDEARAVVIDCNNSLFGSQGYFVSEQAAAIENLKDYGRRQWQYAGRAEFLLAVMAACAEKAREDARLRLAQRPYDEAYERVEPIMRSLVKAVISDEDFATETAANQVLEAAFRHTFDHDWQSAESLAQSQAAEIERLRGALELSLQRHEAHDTGHDGDIISYIKDVLGRRAALSPNPTGDVG